MVTFIDSKNLPDGARMLDTVKSEVHLQAGLLSTLVFREAKAHHQAMKDVRGAATKMGGTHIVITEEHRCTREYPVFRIMAQVYRVAD